MVVIIVFYIVLPVKATLADVQKQGHHFNFRKGKT